MARLQRMSKDKAIEAVFICRGAGQKLAAASSRQCQLRGFVAQVDKDVVRRAAQSFSRQRNEVRPLALDLADVDFALNRALRRLRASGRERCGLKRHGWSGADLGLDLIDNSSPDPSPMPATNDKAIATGAKPRSINLIIMSVG